jgi:hypothetical protein
MYHRRSPAAPSVALLTTVGAFAGQLLSTTGMDRLGQQRDQQEPRCRRAASPDLEQVDQDVALIKINMGAGSSCGIGWECAVSESHDP